MWSEYVALKADGTFQRNRYDAEKGLRAEMEENGRLCRFILHRAEIISEETGSESGSYLSNRYIGGNGVEYLEQDGTTYSFQKDEQGSTVFLLDREKEICGAYAYDGFGNLRKNAGFGKHGNRILYAGQQYDGWSEQYYLRARYYNTKLGRFMQEDPYRGDGLNLYAYCANNPVMYYDPSGYSGIMMCPDGKFASGNEDITTTPEDLYAFGNKIKPRNARAEKDFHLVETTDIVDAQSPPLPTGASTVKDVNKAPLTGDYHLLPDGTKLPNGLGVVADGKDVIPNSPHVPGHHTIFPTEDMSVDQFNDLFQSLPWSHAGTKPKKK